MDDLARDAVASALAGLYPADHPVGMEVPAGGSSCARCEYWQKGSCHNAKFIAWNGSGKIPAPPDRYCCDFYEPGDDFARDAVAKKMLRDFSVIEQAERNADAGLNKQLLFTATFFGEAVKVYSASGEYIRTPVESGGAGTMQFTMGMNWYAAGDPMYPHAREWCAEDEVVVHELMTAKDTLGTIVHELFERWAMKYLGMSYDRAHELIANVAEECSRRVMAAPVWEERLTA